MKNIYIFFVSLLCCSYSAIADEPVLPPRNGGLTVGVDLSRFLLPLIELDRSGWEVSLDYQLSTRAYAVAELGYQRVKDFNRSNYTYNSTGNYLRFGVDKVLFSLNDTKGDVLFSKKVTRDHDYMYTGIRYGFSSMSQNASYILSDNTFGSAEGEERNSINTHWLEGVVGFKVEVFKNLFLGISTRIRYGLAVPKQTNVPHYINAGYGNGRNQLNVGYTYAIFYRIPFGQLKEPQ